MRNEPLSVALEREHREIDGVIATFIEELDCGCLQLASLTATLEVLRRHIYLEEVLLFPPIREAGMVMPILVMMREHGEIWRTMDTVTGLLANGGDRQRLRTACHTLLGQLEAHNAKEEPIIYPHADTDVPPQTSAEVNLFIQSGRMPDNWVCQHSDR
jgi:iron-sulfur cluster repair protein YtfE (RIC family)